MLKYSKEGKPRRFKNITHRNRWVNAQPEVVKVLRRKGRKRMVKGTTQHRATMSHLKKRWSDPANRKRMAERARKMWLDPGYREAHSGSKHWAWKHGEARNFRGSGWPKIRLEIRERDGNKCKNKECGAPYRKGYLVCHHIKPFTGDEERENDSSNLITLCRACHVRVERGHMRCPQV